MSTDIRYTVDLTEPATHLVGIEMRLEHEQSGPVEVVLPSWTPGSYLIREYARHVQEIEAWDAFGSRLAVRKIEKNRWRIDAPAGTAITVRYKLYARDLTVRTNFLDSEFAFLNGPGTFMYVDGLLNVPATVHVITPARWQIITSMRSLSGTTFEATDYDELADSPILCGDLTVEIFDVAGVPHRLAIAGQGNYDLAAVTDDLRKIVQAGADLFGGLPYDRYDFQVMLSDTGGGGLEHSFSNACIFPRLTFRPRKSYERFLAVEAHEHFHAWLVKRIRPQALLPYRYEAEQYTRLLWLMEGMTEYYADRTLLRAGLISSQRYLERLADDIGQLEQTAGRRLQSLEEASFDAWIKHYRPDENTENSSVSYYLKGSLVAAILDLVIRSTTANERSLDDALRALWEDRNVRREGLPEDGAQQMLEAAVGTDLSAVFDRYVRGLDDIDWNHYLGLAGLAVRSTGAGAESDGGTPYLGAKFRRDGLFPVVESVRAGSPAYQAGLSPGDEIVAIDGIRVTRTGWDERLEALGVGETVRLAVFRRGILIEVPVTLGAAPATKYEIVPLEEATPAQTAVRRSWLGE